MKVSRVIIDSMLRTLEGKLVEKGKDFAVLETGGFGFRITMNESALNRLPSLEETVKIYVFLQIKENAWELYGFLEEQSLRIFEVLKTVSGVGPRTALAVLSLGTPEDAVAAIVNREADLLSRAPGVGKKTAERIVLELHEKLKLPNAAARTRSMSLSLDVEEVLEGLGYARNQIRSALEKVGTQGESLEEKLKLALREIARRP